MIAYIILYWLGASALFVSGYIVGRSIAFGIVHDHAVSGENLDNYHGQVYRVEILRDEPC